MPTRALDDTALTGLVADATAAPSMHNAQPWQFRYTRHNRTFALRADFERATPEADDPTTRALHVGCGAALLNLRVSAAHHAAWTHSPRCCPNRRTRPYWPPSVSTSAPAPDGSPRTKPSPLSTLRSGTGTPVAVRSTNR
ncbi:MULTISPECIES: hypothetical protein [unclassified Streptomyces]|uniref:hypothetical protein n=1 Tax=unclassified Streptomyces TaxID=2593676 RepID=UPI0035DAECB4